ncbi:unnamed protein product [Cladocopium goreaui]|uniref:Uncharacterized protein n=1 Tax=Cladocopium goreaui TaxID=2562237 RepID=A0A9P1DNE3_9DINO|nr:unnamed protein product [Cladocopium goreaui]
MVCQGLPVSPQFQRILHHAVSFGASIWQSTVRISRALAPRRLSSRDEDVVHLREFHTVKDAEGSYQSTLHLTDKGRLLHPYLWDKTDFEGEKRASKKEADDSAAKVFWDDPHVLDIARKLRPSKKAQRIDRNRILKNLKNSAKRQAKRLAQRAAVQT